MNCKQGDLARVVHPHLSDNIVRCVEFLGDIDGHGHQYWKIDRKLNKHHHGEAA